MSTQKRTDPSVDAYREVLRECASFNLRKASRVVSQLYDDILQPTGLRSTQVALLVLLAVEPESSMARLARQLMLSPSTLSRNLRPLQRDGLVDIRHTGKRGKSVSLTSVGKKALFDAFPYWQKAQEEFIALVGANTWSTLSRQIAKTTSAARS
jgi:DNA-binding MarR family transcriptional regulator